LTDFVDKFGKYIEEVEKVKEDVSCGMFDDIKNEQMKQLVESRVKTAPKDIENLKNEYNRVREQLVELREEIDNNKRSSPD
jgi:hypothetical protein